MSWSVGFDLDMTLVDTREGIVSALRALSDETGAPIDALAYAERLGPPIQGELGKFFSGAEFDAALARFRELMRTIGVYQCEPLPGAAEAIALVQSLGGNALVVTAKHQPLAELTLDNAGLSLDLVSGDLWAEQKATALLQHNAIGYVGDHYGDLLAARTAGVWSIGVGTGGYTAAELLAHGASASFESLTDSLEWLETRMTERRAG